MSLSVDSLPPNTLPTVLACETLADGVRLQLWLDPDLPWFTGHFPGLGESASVESILTCKICVSMSFPS